MRTRGASLPRGTSLAMASSSLTHLSFASVRASLARRGTRTAARATRARGLVARAQAADASPDAYVVTYCHVRARSPSARAS